MWEWKDEYHGRITEQQKRLGISCDWSRERFTLDEGLSRGRAGGLRAPVRQRADLPRRLPGELVPALQHGLSDLEVELRGGGRPLSGTFRYPLEDGGEYPEVSTTRPETILGDTAVAVHPTTRATRTGGPDALVPVLEAATSRSSPTSYVDPAFGTGAVKVTPAHDPTDYEIGQRHGLPQINVMNDDATHERGRRAVRRAGSLRVPQELWAGHGSGRACW